MVETWPRVYLDDEVEKEEGNGWFRIANFELRMRMRVRLSVRVCARAHAFSRRVKRSLFSSGCLLSSPGHCRIEKMPIPEQNTPFVQGPVQFLLVPSFLMLSHGPSNGRTHFAAKGPPLLRPDVDCGFPRPAEPHSI